MPSHESTAAWLQILASSISGLISGAGGSFLVNFFWPWVKRHRIRKALSIEAVAVSSVGELWISVVNGSPYTMGKAVPYVTIDHQDGDNEDPPNGHSAYNDKRNRYLLKEGQICWAVQEDGKNPLRIDIYSGEKQPIKVGRVHEDSIEILSEKASSPSRVFLKKKPYTGRLKIVSMDCSAKEFPFEIVLSPTPAIRQKI